MIVVWLVRLEETVSQQVRQVTPVGNVNYASALLADRLLPFSETLIQPALAFLYLQVCLLCRLSGGFTQLDMDYWFPSSPLWI